MKRCFRNWEFVCHVAISQSDFIFVLVAGEPVQVIKLDRDGYIIRRVALKETAPFDSRPSFLLCSAHIIVAIDNGLQALREHDLSIRQSCYPLQNWTQDDGNAPLPKLAANEHSL